VAVRHTADVGRGGPLESSARSRPREAPPAAEDDVTVDALVTVGVLTGAVGDDD
jgi:hypothetical protein